MQTKIPFRIVQLLCCLAVFHSRQCAALRTTMSGTPSFPAVNSTKSSTATLGARLRSHASTIQNFKADWREGKDSRLCSKSPVRWGVLFTKMLTSMTLLGIGDVLEQCRTMKETYVSGSAAAKFSTHFDVLRTIRQGTFGFCIAAPMCHFWYPVLERLIPLTGGKLEMFFRVFSRVIVDQGISPFNLAMFVGWTTFWEEGSMANVWTKIVHAVPELLTTCLLYWIPVHMLTFSVVPDNLRVLYIGVMAILWGIILSAFKNGQLEALLSSLSSALFLSSQPKSRPV